MIRRLRLKFICVNMLIVTVMMGVIFGLVYHFTQTGLETQSVSMLQSIAAEPFRPNRPGKPPEGVQLPFFMLELDKDGSLTAAGGGYYDLTDEEFLNTLVSAADESDAPIGVLPEYGLRYCHSVTPFGERIVFADMSSEQAMLSHLLQTCAVIAVLCFAAFLLISWLLARWAVRPVEKAWQQQRQFVADASHELKTPIALIQGYAEGLQDNINDDEESRQFYCDVIIDEAGKMNQMVKKLLTLNQLEFGNDVVAMERFDLTALVKNYIQSAAILTKQHEITVRMEEYPPIYAWADEFKIEEVFMNFFSNAVNHCEDDKIIEVKMEQKDGKVRVSVFNTGKPIPEDSIHHIWEKFYKVDKARTREYGGSGVGLSIVKAIMESMNQQFGVNNYNNGVEFWFELETK